MDPRIGQLSNGRFYAFADGYDHPETVGTLAEVQHALGLRAAVDRAACDSYTVVLHLQYPAWDEVGGIVYEDVTARSKREAIAIVRRQAQDDGHARSGKGRYWFTALLTSGGEVAG